MYYTYLDNVIHFIVTGRIFWDRLFFSWTGSFRALCNSYLAFLCSRRRWSPFRSNKESFKPITFTYFVVTTFTTSLNISANAPSILKNQNRQIQKRVRGSRAINSQWNIRKKTPWVKRLPHLGVFWSCRDHLIIVCLRLCRIIIIMILIFELHRLLY